MISVVYTANSMALNVQTTDNLQKCGCFKRAGWEKNGKKCFFSDGGIKNPTLEFDNFSSWTRPFGELY